MLIHRLLPTALRRDAVRPLIMTDKRHTGYSHIDAHKYDKYPRHGLSDLNRNFLNGIGNPHINNFKPDYGSNAPKQAV